MTLRLSERCKESGVDKSGKCENVVDGELLDLCAADKPAYMLNTSSSPLRSRSSTVDVGREHVT